MTNNPTSTVEPLAQRPAMPDYGISSDPDGLLPWSFADQQLAAARNYWIVTTRPDGRPHAAPVWGVWVDGAFYFGTGPNSRKGRNLQHNPALVVHLESGDDVVILEGVVEMVTDLARIRAADTAYRAKYNVPLMEGDQPTGPLYIIQVQTAYAWLEQSFPGTATRWRF